MLVGWHDRPIANLLPTMSSSSLLHAFLSTVFYRVQIAQKWLYRLSASGLDHRSAVGACLGPTSRRRSPGRTHYRPCLGESVRCRLWEIRYVSQAAVCLRANCTGNSQAAFRSVYAADVHAGDS